MPRCERNPRPTSRLVAAEIPVLVLTTGVLLTDVAAAARACVSTRPTDTANGDFSLDAAAAESYGSDDVLVWYATEGPHVPLGLGESEPPRAVELVLSSVEDAVETLHGELGFEWPLSDSAHPCGNGGDDRIDVYLYDFTAGDGHVGRDDCGSADAPCSGFLIVENDFSGIGYPSTEVGYRTVVPHEYFHLVQAAYAATLPEWWSEGTAQWAAKHVYPELTDLESYLPVYFDRTTRPIDLPPTSAAVPFSYATAIFPVFLEEAFDVTVVRDTFEGLRDGPEIFDALDSALHARGASVAEAFVEFSIWNAATGTRAGSAGYGDAALYPEVQPEILDATLPLMHAGATAGLSATYFQLPDGPMRSVSIETDDKQSRGIIVPLRDGKARIEDSAQTSLDIVGPALVVIAGTTPQLNDAPFTLRVEPPEPESVPTVDADAGAAGEGRAGATADASSADDKDTGSTGLGSESGCSFAPRRDFRGVSGIGCLALLALGCCRGRQIARARRRQRDDPR